MFKISGAQHTHIFLTSQQDAQAHKDWWYPMMLLTNMFNVMTVITAYKWLLTGYYLYFVVGAVFFVCFNITSDLIHPLTTDTGWSCSFRFRDEGCAHPLHDQSNNTNTMCFFFPSWVIPLNHKAMSTVWLIKFPENTVSPKPICPKARGFDYLKAGILVKALGVRGGRSTTWNRLYIRHHSINAFICQL